MLDAAGAALIAALDNTIAKTDYSWIVRIIEKTDYALKSGNASIEHVLKCPVRLTVDMVLQVCISSLI